MSAGTPLGDPIEVGALAEVYGAAGSTLTLMACKSALGHAEPAAGEMVRQCCALPLQHAALLLQINKGTSTPNYIRGVAVQLHEAAAFLQSLCTWQ